LGIALNGIELAKGKNQFAQFIGEGGKKLALQTVEVLRAAVPS